MSTYAKSKIYPEKTGVLRFGPWKNLSVRTFVGSSQGFGQKPITNAPLPYILRKARTWDPPVSTVGADSSLAASRIADGTFSSFETTARNKAYGRFTATISKNTANLALTLADWSKSRQMIVQRVGQVLRAARALRKGRLDKVAKELGVKKPRSSEKLRWVRKHQTFRRPVPAKQPFWNKRRAKYENVSPQNVWLEYSFGWAPLLQDIYNSCKILTENVPAPTAKGRAKSYFTLSRPTGESTYPTANYMGEVAVLMQSEIVITNPNVLLLQQAGLVNLAHVVWDAIPFSFIIDWFFSLGKFIRSWSDFLGIAFRNPFTTVSYRVADSCPGAATFSMYTRNSVAYQVTRTLGTTGFRYTPVFRLNWDLWKTTTSVALITQLLLARPGKH